MKKDKISAQERSTVLKAVEVSGYALKFQEKKFTKDKEIALTAVKRHGDALMYVHKSLRSDKDIVETAIRLNPTVAQYVGKNYLDNKKFMEKIIKRSPKEFQYASSRLKNDKEFVLKAVKAGACALEFVPKKFKNDRNFVLEILHVKYSINYLKNFWDDKEIMMKSIQYGDNAYAKIKNSPLNDDEELLFASLEKHKDKSLEFASNNLQGNKGIVLKAIEFNAGNFKFASKELRDDYDVVELATKKLPQMIEFVSKRIKADKQFYMNFLENPNSIRYLRYASKNILQDEEFIAFCLPKTQGYGCSILVSGDLRREFLIEIIEKHPYIYPHLDFGFRNDKEIAIIASTFDSNTLRLPAVFRTDKDVALAAVNSNGLSIRNFPALHSDKDVVQAAIRNCEDCIRFIKEPLDFDDVKLAISLGYCEARFDQSLVIQVKQSIKKSARK